MEGGHGVVFGVLFGSREGKENSACTLLGLLLVLL